MSQLPTSNPVVSTENEPFWTAAAEGRIHLPRCNDCGDVIWYPRDWCPSCGGDVTWKDVASTGTVYSFSIVMKGQGRWRDAGPYVVAYVDLDAGPRMMTNIVDVDPSEIEIGMAVTAVFDPTEDGPSLIRFAPTGT